LVTTFVCSVQVEGGKGAFVLGGFCLGGHTPLAMPNCLPTNHSWTLWTGGCASSQWEDSTVTYNECTRQYNLSVDFNKNVYSKRQNVESKMEKW